MISKGFKNHVFGRTLKLSTVGLGIGWFAWGATYNLYFNNTEQGANSTATPSLSVVDGKSNGTATNMPIPNSSATPAPATPVGENSMASANPPTTGSTPSSPTPAAAAASPNQSTLAKAPTPEERSSNETKHWRLLTSVAALKTHEGPPFFGGLLEAGYFFNSDLGVNIFASVVDQVFSNSFNFYGVPFYFGGEVEWAPIKVAFGPINNLIQIGVLAGVSSVANNSNWFSAHVGVRTGINFGDRWGISAGLRGNLGTLLGDVGLSIKL